LHAHFGNWWLAVSCVNYFGYDWDDQQSLSSVYSEFLHLSILHDVQHFHTNLNSQSVDFCQTRISTLNIQSRFKGAIKQSSQALFPDPSSMVMCPPHSSASSYLFILPPQFTYCWPVSSSSSKSCWWWIFLLWRLIGLHYLTYGKIIFFFLVLYLIVIISPVLGSLSWSEIDILDRYFVEGNNYLPDNFRMDLDIGWTWISQNSLPICCAISH
jgi:hypothetical protein